MRHGVLGTGSVGRAIAAKLGQLGHEVRVGTRDPEAVMEREAGPRDDASFAEWLARTPGVTVGTFADAARHGDVVANCTRGTASLAALESAGSDALGGKVLIDVANPLVFSEEVMSLFVPSTDSLAERIQRTFPEARVVKTLNTVNAAVMTDPGAVGGGDHTMFLCGNDDEAKTTVAGILRSFGWTHLLDLGDLSAARGMEAYLLLWLRLVKAEGAATLNIKVVT